MWERVEGIKSKAQKRADWELGTRMLIFADAVIFSDFAGIAYSNGYSELSDSTGPINSEGGAFLRGLRVSVAKKMS